MSDKDNVITGKVTIKKKNEIQKVADAFKSAEKGNMGHRIVADIVEPIMKKALSDIVSSTMGTISGILTNGVDMLLFKEPRHMNNGNNSWNGVSTGNSGSVFSYSNCFNNSKPATMPNDNVYSYEGLEFSNRGDAERMLELLRQQIDDHGIVHVATLYQAANLPVKPIHFKYGWTEINEYNARVVRLYNNKYSIRLPKAGYIKND